MRQMSLLTTGQPAVPDRVGAMQRIHLGSGAWVDWCPQWLPGAEGWLRHLRDDLRWRGATRPMYERIVTVPRLMVHFERGGAAKPDQPMPRAFDDLAIRFETHYRCPFPTVGCNWYRDGNDSVAWHADRVRRPGNSIVAIIGVGERRPFLLRPMPGGAPRARSRRWLVGDGDLIVLGGTIQADWQHAVPKVRNAGERISIMIRSAEHTD